MSLRITIGLLALSAALPATATDRFNPLTTPTQTKSAGWETIERLEDRHPKLVQERFTKLVEHTDPEVVAGFGGDASPPSAWVLLHHAKGWKAANKGGQTPVLLVHGAGLTANHCFTTHPIEQPYEGLANRLVRSGRAAFALTFAHMHGDNLLQAEQVANAIARVRHLTKATQVDLVAHSKGGMSCRIYLSNAGASWATKYRGDVRRYVMLGTPNGGIDVSFAYPNLNYWILENKSPAPLCWTEGLYYGKWIDWSDRTLYKGGPFPGQAQMVARWDHRYGRTRAKGQFDIDVTYDGGRGKVSVGKGIDQAIADGGDLIQRLQKQGIDPRVELAVLAGTNPYVMRLIGERRGPSDGLLLVASVFSTDGLTRRGAPLVRRDLRYWNHLQLVYEPRANDWVVGVLEQAKTRVKRSTRVRRRRGDTRRTK